MKNLVFIIFLFAVLGCSKSKDDEINIVTGVYQPEVHSTQETLVLITKNGRTTDKDTIRKFLNYQQDFYNIKFNNSFPLDGKTQQTSLFIKSINFQSSNTATVTYFPGTLRDENRAALIKKADNNIIIEYIKTDTLVWGQYMSGDFVKYPIKVSNNLLPIMIGDLRALNFSFPIKVTDNKLYVPILNYMLVEKYHKLYATGNIQNFLGDNIEKQLGANDTLLAQVRLVRLLKQ